VKVLFDAQVFCSQEFGGISRYFCGLAKSLAEVPDVQPRILAPLYINSYLEGLPSEIVRGYRMRYLTRAALPMRAFSVLTGALLERTARPDIIHRTYYYPVPAAPRSARTVLTVYDMIHEKFPLEFSAGDPVARWKAKAVAKADHVICISNQTRQDLLSLCDISTEKVSVIHLGFTPLDGFATYESPADFRSRKLGADVPYLLYVGSRSRYKNFSGLLAAYASSPQLHRNFRLLCFGGGAFTGAERSMIERHDATDEVVQIGGSDAVLAECYRNATLFVYPSLYEGFGIPPLEAMSLGCPVACSNASSILEVVGDAAVTFDATHPQAIRATLECALDSQAKMDTLIEKGKERCLQFSWRRCAEDTAKIYRKAIGGR